MRKLSKGDDEEEEEEKEEKEKEKTRLRIDPCSLDEPRNLVSVSRHAHVQNSTVGTEAQSSTHTHVLVSYARSCCHYCHRHSVCFHLHSCVAC